MIGEKIKILSVKKWVLANQVRHIMQELKTGLESVSNEEDIGKFIKFGDKRVDRLNQIQDVITKIKLPPSSWLMDDELYVKPVSKAKIPPSFINEIHVSLYKHNGVLAGHADKMLRYLYCI